MKKLVLAFGVLLIAGASWAHLPVGTTFLAVQFPDANVPTIDGNVTMTIPKGANSGQTLRLKGKGTPGSGKGGPGDALIEIEVRPDPRFKRDGDDITIDLPISLSEAVLGGKIRVPTPTGDVTMTVPAGANSGTTLRLKGKGAPRRGGARGDEFVKLRIVLEKPIDPDLRAFVSNWEAGKAFNPREDIAR